MFLEEPLLFSLALVACTHGANNVPMGQRIVAAARQQMGVTTKYDPAYKALKFHVIGHFRLKDNPPAGPGANTVAPVRTNRLTK